MRRVRGSTRLIGSRATMTGCLDPLGSAYRSPVDGVRVTQSRRVTAARAAVFVRPDLATFPGLENF